MGPTYAYVSSKRAFHAFTKLLLLLERVVTAPCKSCANE